ncbi:MAG: DNA-directed RNA polymerase subunit alpha [Dehalococcoidales bacterium]|nr:DNA-directed RNA polymerase subunit alpha [Dehalococcoidales bacterium]
MFGLAIPKIECVDSSDKYGRFLTLPLEKGFGTTLGNAMRRVLLQNLPGAAVPRIQIEGVQHEFSPIPHVKEDVLEFLLNLKALRLKLLSDKPVRLTLEKETEGEVYASDINPSSEVEIVNPELYLATLDSSEVKLYVDMDIEMGIGYKPAKSSDSLPVGMIPVDAIFTPVRKVNFTVEPINIGQETSLEQLYLEVWTDGTISPVSAISYAASLLTEQLAPFVDYGQVSQAEEEKKALRASIPKDLFNMPMEQLDLSVRAMNCLRRSGITTVGELVSTGGRELLALRNFGQKSKQEVEERLKALGLTFSLEVEDSES